MIFCEIDRSIITTEGRHVKVCNSPRLRESKKLSFFCIRYVYIVLYPDSSISAFLAIVIKKRSYAEELSNELLANTLKNVLY